MPTFFVKTREKYAHITTYNVDAPTAAEAVRMVKANEVEDYESTTIDGYDPDDEFLGVVEVIDQDGNEVEVPEDPGPPHNRTRLTFEIVTTDVWDDAGIAEVVAEFESTYGGNLNVASACLVEVKDIYVNPDADDGAEDDPSAEWGGVG